MRKPISWTTEKKTQTLEKLTQMLQKKSDVVFAYIFGSFVNHTYFRDLDLAIYLNPMDRSTFDSFEQNLGSQIELETRIPTDIIILNLAPLSLKFHITKGKLLFSRNENIRLKFLEETWLKYWDFQSHRRRMLWQILS